MAVPVGTTRPVSDRRTSKYLDSLNDLVLPPISPEELVECINSDRLDLKSKARVKRIIKLLQKYQSFLGWGRVRTDAQRDRLYANVSDVAGDIKDLDEMLGRYWVSPRLMPYKGMPRIAYAAPKSKRATPTHGLESGAVICSIQLAVRDELERVRECNCGKAFFAKRIDQHFCSAACRVRFHQSSEEFKAKRRAYLRKLYRLKQSGKVKQ